MLAGGYRNDRVPLLPVRDAPHDALRVSFAPLPIRFGSPLNIRVRGLVRVSAWQITCVVCGLPCIALCLVVVLSLWSNFEAATRTHCGVRNLLPSISAAIDSPSTLFIWRLFIYLHLPPRFLAVLIYRRVVPRGIAGRVCVLLNVIELSSLFSLSYFDSDSSHSMHVASFTCFGTASIFHMLLNHYLVATSTESKRWKRRWLSSCILSIMMCVLLFYRHNAFCEPYVFTIFAVFEYIFVISNIAFHSSFYLDFPTHHFHFF